jgi:SAM-dependent methyltransferase
MVNTQEYHERRRVWQNKPQIRLVYERWVARMRPFLPPGPLLEVGSGSGLLKDLLPEVILSDVAPLPWIDQVVDCMRMPFEAGSLGGIIAIDLLHHVANPHVFLDEAARVLRPGGRALLIEPYITPVSYLGYRLLHHEDVYLRDYHRGANKDGSKADPWEGNLALPTLVFKRDLKDWNKLHPNLTVAHRELFSFLDFQCAAGFKPYAYLPHSVFRRLVKLDDRLGFILPIVAFRVFVALEKSGPD